MKPVIVRQVWSFNFRRELQLIRSIIHSHPIAAMDTEFPGNLFHAGKNHSTDLSPEINYSVMKKNVDALRPIQLGLAFSDANGNLPDFGTENSYVWEFNFSDFHPKLHVYNADSIELLKKQGVNFDRNRDFGVKSRDFAAEVYRSGLISIFPQLCWVTFQGSYDFGYIIKILSQSPLPDDMEDFMGLVTGHFGNKIYDIKHAMKFCNGLYGGLEKVAKALDVDRVAGVSHQAGSDSLLTLQAFLKLVDMYFDGRLEEIRHLGGFIHGLGLVWVEDEEKPAPRVRWVQEKPAPRVCWVQGYNPAPRVCWVQGYNPAPRVCWVQGYNRPWLMVV